MNPEITIILKPEQENNFTLIKKLLAAEAKKNGISLEENFTFKPVKKSIDARRGNLKIVMRYKLFSREFPEQDGNSIPEWKKACDNKKVIIIGAGPAGLFGALKLLERGIKPVIIERGSETQKRKRDIAAISTKGFVNADSNYCFGEGGAGTFSDGKLYTRSNKRGSINEILAIFNYFGADASILTDAHPHIGTNRLPQIINAMRKKITDLGGEFYFDTRLTDFILDPCADGKKKIKGVVCMNTTDMTEKSFYAEKVVLATGHSASDIYKLIARAAPEALEAKTFAIGVRVEHPRELIDKIQFHGKDNGNLGAAEYRVTTQVDERGVYSFCMCPGGFVVPSASENDGIVVNGMSSCARNSAWSNAAIVVETRPEDIPQEFKNEAEKAGCPSLAGLFYRTKLEQLAKSNGKGQSAPAQKLTDFLEGKPSSELPKSSYTPGLVSSNLRQWLPDSISERLAKGFTQINKNMKGFISPKAVMIAIETRTSTPVRILRDKETLESPFIKGLYPAGEGSGYSGGIVSSAMDGENVCKCL